MRVRYKGMDQDYSYRTAEITYDEDTEQETVDRIVKLMEIKGWKIDTVVAGFYICEVDDRDEFTGFMEDWKECKKCILNCIKFGF